jgi:NAD(P)-dependent dehydrogenase (short-subunit alcohol dehydrogenase family)
VKLAGKVAVITGAGNGIGAACARRFAAEGAKLVLTDLEGEAVRAVAEEIGGVAEVGDITAEATVKATADLARRTHGRIDVWFSNAGFSGERQPADPQAEDVWALSWNLHLMAHVRAAREVLPEMAARGEGYLLHTASSIALTLQPDKAAYTVTKHAALAFSEWLAVHYRPKGVRVSCFCPGPMNTRMFRANEFPDDHPAVRAALTPEQVADLIVRGIEAQKFLILQTGPADAAPQLLGRATDYEAWLNAQSAAAPSGPMGAVTAS